MKIKNYRSADFGVHCILNHISEFKNQKIQSYERDLKLPMS